MPERCWEILGLLALHRGEHLARREIADTIWPDVPDDTALANLRRHLHVASQALENYSEHPWFSSDKRSVWWNELSANRCDVHDFLEHCAAGNSHLAAESYTGELLAGMANDWIEPFRLRVDSLALEVFIKLTHGSDDVVALAAAERILTIDPYNETALRRVLELLCARGERAAATVRYRSFTMAMMIDLHSKPSDLTRTRYHALVSDAEQSAITGERTPETALIGRANDIKNILTAFERNGIVTLIGPGGVGKTRLALEVAFIHRTSLDFESAFVDFSHLREQDNLVAHLLEALGINAGGSSEMAALRSATAARKYLIVLDNSEHVINRITTLVDELSEISSLRVLITSRKPIVSNKVVTYRVEPLAFPTDESETITVAQHPAVGLFLLRASEVSPGLLIDNEAKRHASNIVRTLDGLPLAIEIVASRANSVSLNDIDRILATDVDLAHSSPPLLQTKRHSSLRSALDWSSSLLSTPARRLLPRLTVFPGSWDIDAAYAICSDRETLPHFVAHLSELVDVSFVTHRVTEPHTPYSLPETVRRYAGDQLDSRTLGNLRKHLAELYLARAIALTDLRNDQGLLAYMGQTRPNAKNLLAAIRYFQEMNLPINASHVVYALAWYWRRTGFTIEGLKVVRELLSNARADDEKLALLFRTAGILANSCGDWQAGITYNERAEAAFFMSGNRIKAIEARVGAEHARHYVGKSTTAESILLWENAAAELADLGNKIVEAEVRSSLAVLYNFTGQFEDARAAFLTALAIFREASKPEHEARTYLQMCPLYRALGMPEEALHCATQALNVLAKIGDHELIAHALTLAADLRIHSGHLDLARSNLGDAFLSLRKTHDPRFIVQALELTATLFSTEGKTHDAVRTLGFALQMERLAGMRPLNLLTTSREVLIEDLRRKVGPNYDAIEEFGITLTLHAVEESLRG